MSFENFTQAGVAGENLKPAVSAPPLGCDETCALYGGLPVEVRQKLHSQSAAFQRPAGALVFDEGDEATHLYQISAGVVQEYKMLPDGRRIITAFHYPGDLVGMTFGPYRPSAAEAVTDVVLRSFSRRTLADFNERLPGFGRGLLYHLSNELSNVQGRLLLLGRKTALERVASFLIELSERAARHGESPTHLWIPMRREAIADHLGLTLETVSRVFSKLRREGLISGEYKNCLDLLDLEALYDLANGA